MRLAHSLDDFQAIVIGALEEIMCIMQAVIVNVSFCWFRGQYDRSAAGGHNN